MTLTKTFVSGKALLSGIQQLPIALANSVKAMFRVVLHVTLFDSDPQGAKVEAVEPWAYLRPA